MVTQCLLNMLTGLKLLSVKLKYNIPKVIASLIQGKDKAICLLCNFACGAMELSTTDFLSPNM